MVKRSRPAICPQCFYAMNRLYFKDTHGGKIRWIGAGWFCPKCGTYTDSQGYRLIPRKPEVLREICRQ